MKERKMNVNKILCALIVAFVVVGLTGAVSAYIQTQTDIHGTYITSESLLGFSNCPTETQYESTYVAELSGSPYPPVDVSWTGAILTGDTYTYSNELQSNPMGSMTTWTLSDPSEISGSVSYWHCALWSDGEPQQVILLPTAGQDEIASGWYSLHPSGSAYAGEFHEEMYVFWP